MSLIVLEGLDGSGKSTQVKRLLKYFTDNNIKHKYLHFPRTDTPVYGHLVSRFLRGESGDINQVDPYLIALIYAGDRKDASKMIQEWLDDGNVVLLDRYVYSNIGFQCAKVEDKNERDTLLNWILDLEFKHFAIPKPDISLFLDVPFSFTVNNLTSDRDGEDREYLNGKDDIHEADFDFQKRVREIYRQLLNIESNYLAVKCNDENNNVLTADEIHNNIISKLRKFLN